MNLILKIKEFLLIKKYQLRALELQKQKKPVFFVFVGIPCSGKTTTAKNVAKKFNAIRIATDDIKVFLYNQNVYNLEHIFRVQHLIIKKLVRQKINIISDANSSKQIFREQLKQITFPYGYSYLGIYCYADFETILHRMSERKNFISSNEQLKKYQQEIEETSDLLSIDTEHFSQEDIVNMIEKEYEKK